MRRHVTGRCTEHRLEGFQGKSVRRVASHTDEVPPAKTVIAERLGPEVLSVAYFE